MELKIEYLELDKLRPYENNARKHADEDVDAIAASIQQFGFDDPIGIWSEDNLIVEGHGRLLAAKKLGMDKVPCIRLDHLTDEERRAYALAHNRTAELSGWDFDVRDEELARIGEIDMSAFGFYSDFAKSEEVIDDDYNGELPEEPKSKIGDIYQLGEHRLICGDSTDVNVIDKLMDGVNADMVFTDPPYGMNAVSKSGVLSEHYKTDIMNDNDNTVAIASFNLISEMFKDVKQVWWGANYYTECLPSAECWIVWDKNNGSSDQTDCELAWTNFRSVVRKFTMASEKINRVHPTQKPCKLFAEVLNKFEKEKKFEIVLDVFGGSGSTLIACEQLNRKCFMVELDPHYVDVIIDRWEKFTGKKAVLLNG